MHLFCHELRLLLISPASYIAGVLFLLLLGFIYLFILQDFTQYPQKSLPSIIFFSAFWIPVFFTVPLITMKSFAEERRLGTLETLMTTPVSSIQVVMSKFFAAYSYYCFLWVLTFSFPLIAHFTLPLGATQGRLLDFASNVGGGLFIALSGFFYIAIGIFASSLTRSQLVAGMLGFSMLFLVIVGGRLLEALPLMETFNGLKVSIDYLQTFQQLDDFSRGVLDTRPVIFYFSNAFLLLGLTAIVVESKS